MALFRGIQEYIALDANNITLVFDSGNIVNISGNIFLYPPQGHPILYNYYPYRAFGGQNKIVYSTRLVRRAIFFNTIARTLCDQSFNRESRYAPPTLVTVATSHKLSLSCDDKMAAGSHPQSLDR